MKIGFISATDKSICLQELLLIEGHSVHVFISIGHNTPVSDSSRLGLIYPNFYVVNDGHIYTKGDYSGIYADLDALLDMNFIVFDYNGLSQLHIAEYLRSKDMRVVGPTEFSTRIEEDISYGKTFAEYLGLYPTTRVGKAQRFDFVFDGSEFILVCVRSMENGRSIILDVDHTFLTDAILIALRRTRVLLQKLLYRGAFCIDTVAVDSDIYFVAFTTMFMYLIENPVAIDIGYGNFLFALSSGSLHKLINDALCDKVVQVGQHKPMESSILEFSEAETLTPYYADLLGIFDLIGSLKPEMAICDIEEYPSRSKCVILRKSGTVIGGYVWLEHKGGRLELVNIVVHPEYTHQGYGSRLIRDIISRADDNAVTLVLDCQDSLISWYETFGFKIFMRDPAGEYNRMHRKTHNRGSR